VPTVVIMPKKKAARAVTKTASGTQRKRRQRPPWGKLLRGKPIKRYEFIAGEKIDVGDIPRVEQFAKMMLLLGNYGIVGHVPTYPVGGLDDSGWWRWYELALAIASDLDDSLKIVDGQPGGKTAALWRGFAGASLISMVNLIKEARPNRSVRWCLQEVRKKICPNSYGRIPLDQLEVRYCEAKRHHGTTKRTRKSGPAS
jgi:hypothetical protein